MNTCSFTCSRERTVLNARHATPRVADVLFASPLLGLFGVRRTSEIRPLSTNERSPLFGFGFFGRNAAHPRFTQTGFMFVSPFVLADRTKKLCVAVFQVLGLRKALQIFQSVVRFNAVNVVDLFGGVKTRHPTLSNGAMNQRFAHDQIPAGMQNRRVTAMLSENFPAARDGVKVIKGSVFDAIYRKAYHAVSSVVTNMILSIRF